MKQSDLGPDLRNRRTRKQVFLDGMELVVPWQELLALIVPHAPVKATGRKPFPGEAMLRIQFMQQWFGLSDVAMEEALYDVPLYRQFARLSGMSRLPDRVSILRFRHLLERHQLAKQFLRTVNAQLSAKGYLLKEGTARTPRSLLRRVRRRTKAARGTPRCEEHAAMAYAVRPEQPMDNAWTTDGRGHCMSAKATRAGRQSAPSLCRTSRCIRAWCRAACTASALC